MKATAALLLITAVFQVGTANATAMASSLAMNRGASALPLVVIASASSPPSLFPLQQASSSSPPLHAIRIHGWTEQDDERGLACQLDVASWADSPSSTCASPTGRTSTFEPGPCWQLRQRWRLYAPVHLITLDPHEPTAQPCAPSRALVGRKPPSTAPLCQQRWMLQLSCSVAADDVDEEGWRVRVPVAPRRIIVDSESGERVHSFMLLHPPSAGMGRSARPTCPAPPAWMQRFARGWRRMLRQGVAAIADWPGLRQLGWCVHELRLAVRGAQRQGGDALLKVLSVEPFVALFSFWRAAWTELRCVFNWMVWFVAALCGLTDAASSSRSLASLLSVIAQLAFLHLAFAVFRLGRPAPLQLPASDAEAAQRMGPVDIGGLPAEGGHRRRLQLPSSALEAPSLRSRRNNRNDSPPPRRPSLGATAAEEHQQLAPREFGPAYPRAAAAGGPPPRVLDALFGPSPPRSPRAVASAAATSELERELEHEHVGINI